jgi:hypothetical protein
MVSAGFGVGGQAQAGSAASLSTILSWKLFRCRAFSAAAI